MVQSLIAQRDAPIEDSVRSFAQDLKHLRQKLGGKQIWLSNAIGCTVAAISQWESGVRLPNPWNLSRIVAFLAESGASTPELLALRRAWQTEMVQRSKKLDIRSRRVLEGSR